MSSNVINKKLSAAAINTGTLVIATIENILVEQIYYQFLVNNSHNNRFVC